MGFYSTSVGFEDYGSTAGYTTGGTVLCSTGAITDTQSRDYARANESLRAKQKAAWAEWEQVRKQQQAEPVKKGRSMTDEFKSYLREYKDWIFTIAIVAIIDHFFLDGALKEKLAGALGKKLDADNGKGA